MHFAAIRLVSWDGYDHPQKGVVHIFKDGTWGSICGQINKNSLIVLCKMMGYE